MLVFCAQPNEDWEPPIPATAPPPAASSHWVSTCFFSLLFYFRDNMGPLCHISSFVDYLNFSSFSYYFLCNVYILLCMFIHSCRLFFSVIFSPFYHSSFSPLHTLLQQQPSLIKVPDWLTLGVLMSLDSPVSANCWC